MIILLYLSSSKLGMVGMRLRVSGLDSRLRPAGREAEVTECDGEKGGPQAPAPPWASWPGPLCACARLPVGTHTRVCVYSSEGRNPMLLCVWEHSSYCSRDKAMFSPQIKLFPKPIVAREP